MKYTLIRLCDNCPFRHDVRAYLTPERAEEIGTAITDMQQTFACHKTTVPDDDGDEDGSGSLVETENSQHCAGALILLEKLEQPNQMMRIAERLGMCDRRKLDMGAPVFNSVDEFIDAQPSRNKRRK